LVLALFAIFSASIGLSQSTSSSSSNSQFEPVDALNDFRETTQANGQVAPPAEQPVPPSETAPPASASTAEPMEKANAPAEVSVPKEASLPAEATAVVPLIDAGDLLKVSIFGAPESDQEVRVSATGDISLNFIGPVHVAGVTTEQAQTVIAKKLTDGAFFAEPQVSVFVKEYATQGVSVLGEVQKPGVYPLLGARRLFDVMSLAGGATDRAGKIVSITRRDRPQEVRSVTLSRDSEKSLQSNVEVFPGDTVMVSKAGVVYVVGDVRKPSGVIMDNSTDMTVLQALAMAEGALPTASLNKARLIRKTPSGPQEIPLQLKNMLAAKSPDVHLQAEDIVFVPTSTARSVGKQTLDAVVRAATGIVTYRRY
jgi:polysaccharide export outer membrane protein